MKKIICIILLLPQLAFSKRAMIIVLEAPIFKKPSTEARIVQYARKGSIIYIDNRDIVDDPTAFTNKVITFKDVKIPVPPSGKQRWYTTLDRNGQQAFVLGQHIKVIYNDFREFNEDISKDGHDPTDYRLTEPIADNYPFTEGKEFRFNLAIGLGPGQKSNYNYNAPLSREDYRIRNGVAINILWPTEILKHFRIGLNAGFYSQMRRFYLDDGQRSANETGGSFSLGPTINFDQFKGKSFQITYSAGLNFNWARYFVEQQSLNSVEERLFSGIYLTPKIYSTFQWQRVFFDSVDLLLQLEGIFDYPHSYNSKSDPILTPFWTPDNDKISVPGGATFLLYFGVQAKI
ncbi:MAG: hypothetical protein DRQ88_09420 [Epsilonproteobacteria bacterium]|nr:MAG: hypothetical protein DRQ88_09420 [Campylobacterota bacterium]